MTCKDCLCYEACQYHITEETNFTVNECSTGFKYKELYIQLPVYIGQSVWRVYKNPYNKLVTIIKGKVSMLQQKADKSWKFRVSNSSSLHDYTLDDIGLNVFLSEKQAEVAAYILRKETADD